MTKRIFYFFEKYAEQKSFLSKFFFLNLIRIEKVLLVNKYWFLKLKCRNFFTKKVKICFGPIADRENTLGTRKWAIDPIVKSINKHSTKYSANVFFGDEKTLKCDIVVIVRNFEMITAETIKKLKRNNIILIYNPRDNPQGCSKSYKDNDWFINAMDGIIISSPLQRKDFQEKCQNVQLISSPVINDKYRKNYKDKKYIDIIWQGYTNNAGCMQNLHPILKQIQKNSSKNIRFIYNSNCAPQGIDNENIFFVKWKISHWQKMLAKSDIGIVIKPLDSDIQQKKPPTKVLSYMSAGLPVICTPSEADKEIIEHGETGFIAYTDEEWMQFLEMLIEQKDLRERMGKAAREYATKNFNVDIITQHYINFFDKLRNDSL